MNRTSAIPLLAAAAMALVLGAFPALAQTYKVKDMVISRAFATPTVAGAPTGAVYLSFANRGKTPDRLVGAATRRAKRVELHIMSMSGDVMRMREVDAIEAAPGDTVAMRPGTGIHLMLVGLTAPLRVGEKFPITLRFEKSGPVDVEVVVEQQAAQPAQSRMH